VQYESNNNNDDDNNNNDNNNNLILYFSNVSPSVQMSHSHLDRRTAKNGRRCHYHGLSTPVRNTVLSSFVTEEHTVMAVYDIDVEHAATDLTNQKLENNDLDSQCCVKLIIELNKITSELPP